jgi:hypothetical protein
LGVGEGEVLTAIGQTSTFSPALVIRLQHTTGLAGKIPAARLHNGGRPSNPDVEASPFASTCSLDGEHVLLTERIDEAGCRRDGFDNGGREHKLSTRPFGQISQIGGI